MSAATTHRAAQLGMSPVLQGVADKAEALARLAADEQWPLETIAYMGDDVLDVPVLTQVGLATCPADAVEAVRRMVHWVSPHAGGRGAARSLVDLVLGRAGSADAPSSRVRPSAVIARLSAPARRPHRPARRARRRQGVGALQAARGPLDRPAQGPPVAALHPGPELSRRQPARSRDRGVEPGRTGRRGCASRFT